MYYNKDINYIIKAKKNNFYMKSGMKGFLNRTFEFVILIAILVVIAGMDSGFTKGRNFNRNNFSCSYVTIFLFKICLGIKI